MTQAPICDGAETERDYWSTTGCTKMYVIYVCYKFDCCLSSRALYPETGIYKAFYWTSFQSSHGVSCLKLIIKLFFGVALSVKWLCGSLIPKWLFKVKHLYSFWKCTELHSLFLIIFTLWKCSFGKRRQDWDKLLRFAGGTTILDLITNNDKTTYKEEIACLLLWC